MYTRADTKYEHILRRQTNMPCLFSEEAAVGRGSHAGEVVGQEGGEFPRMGPL